MLSECHYQAIVQTALLCPLVPIGGISHDVGTNIISAQCCGGIYDLSSLRQDNIYGYGQGAEVEYVIRVSGTSPAPQCGGQASVCNSYQYNYYGTSLALWEPEISPVVWQYLGDGSVSAILQSGQGCYISSPSNTVVNLTFVSDEAAAFPTFISVVETQYCSIHDHAATKLVCGAAFQVQPSTSSSSTGSASPPPVTNSSAVPDGYDLILGELDRGLFGYLLVYPDNQTVVAQFTATQSATVTLLVVQITEPIQADSAIQLSLYDGQQHYTVATSVVYVAAGQTTLYAEVPGVSITVGGSYSIGVYVFLGRVSIASLDETGVQLQVAALAWPATCTCRGPTTRCRPATPRCWASSTKACMAIHWATATRGRTPARTSWPPPRAA